MEPRDDDINEFLIEKKNMSGYLVLLSFHY